MSSVDRNRILFKMYFTHKKGLIFYLVTNVLLLITVKCEQAPNSQSSVLFKCPEQFGYYADNNNCSKYFVCVFGEALHESCTGGLRFSSELQTCDWPRNVVCLVEGNYFSMYN